MIRVYGFEGSWPKNAAATWGAAALLVADEVVRNAYSGQTMALRELTAPDAPDVVTLLPEDVSIEDQYGASDVTVVALRRTSHFYLFKTRLGTTQGLITRRPVSGNTFYYVFATREAFSQYSSRVSARVFGDFLRNETREPEAKRNILYDALALDPHSPYLHVLRTLASPNVDATRVLVAASLRSDADRETYRQLLEACTADRLEYRLKYDGGIAKGRGLEVGRAQKQFAAIQTMDDRLIPYLRKTVPFLREQGTQTSPLRVTLEAGSAEIVFSAIVEGEPLFRRVARYIELTYLQDALRGDLPEDLSTDPSFTDALETIANPSPDTQLSHKPLGRDQYEEVVVRRTVANKFREDGPISLLGTPQGASGEMRRIDIKLFPGLREVVSLDNDGEGGLPTGRDFFRQRNDFMFRPFVFRMWRQLDNRGKHVFWLQSAKLLETGTTDMLDAVPSSVIPGAFFRTPSMQTAVHIGEVLTIDGDSVGEVGNPSLVTWEVFLRRYADWCERYELDHGLQDNAVWIPPARRRAPPRLIRTLVALSELDGTASFERIRELDAKTYPRDRIARFALHNLFQEHSDLLQREDRDEDYQLTLTARGAQLVRVFLRAQEFLASMPTFEDDEA